MNAEKRLKNKLFCNYDKNIRPGESSKATIVTARMNVKNFDYEDDANVLTISAWFTSSWQDNRLTWTKSDFSEISSIHMKSEFLWNPDFKVFDSDVESPEMCHNVSLKLKSFIHKKN